MKTFTISAAVALLAAFAQAVPAPATTVVPNVQITFEGADYAALYTLSFPLDGTTVQINNDLSISYIQSAGGAICTFYGSHGSVTTVTGTAPVVVGPPQPQVSGSCRAA
ncbi:hypothetical protein MMC29_000996 [Sticta canariensis]|nr:hypothetical protein [Sticta canariensis]